MHRDTQIEITRQLLAHIEAGSTSLADDLFENPVDVFTSPERLQRERRELFLKYPQAMGLSGMLPGPNTYFVDDHTGLPILMTRDARGVAHAFLNVCRHRGARVAEGQGGCDRPFICPYHGWAYRADGTLAGIPDQRSFDGLCESRNALTPLPLVERDGILWVSLDPANSLDLEFYLGNLSPEIESYGLGGYYHYQTKVLRQRMNWKIAVDTFLEPYHFSVLHKNTVAPLLISNLCQVDGFGRHVREVFPRHTISQLRDQAETEWDLFPHSTVLYLLFPNSVLVYQIDHVEFWRIYPDGDRPDRCVVSFEFYVPEPVTSDKAREHWEKNFDLTMRTVETEDFPAGEGIQNGMGTGAQDAVVYGRNEPALQYFHQQLREAHAAA